MDVRVWNGWSVLVVIAVLLAPALAGAQQRTLTLENASPPVVIPLLDAPVELNNRVVTIPCATVGGVCPIGSAVQAATATFSCAGCGSARVGTQVSLAWNSQYAETCFATSTGPAATSWAGLQGLFGSGRGLLFSAPGSYTLTLRCFGASGSSPLRSIAVAVAP